MNHIMYTELNFTMCGSPVLFCDMGVVDERVTRSQIAMQRAFPSCSKSHSSVFNHHTTYANTEDGLAIAAVALGDTIWSSSSPVKQIAGAIIYDQDGNLNMEALASCLDSIVNKCLKEKWNSVGFPVFDIKNWKPISLLIEEKFDGTGIQPIVHAFDNRELLDVFNLVFATDGGRIFDAEFVPNAV